MGFPDFFGYLNIQWLIAGSWRQPPSQPATAGRNEFGQLCIRYIYIYTQLLYILYAYMYR